LKGINGIMVDISGLAVPTLGSSDFQFNVGNTNDPSSWTAAPVPANITVRAGAGVGGSDRVTIVWADNAIQEKWLQVTVLANVHIWLTANDVFYWGNQIGETGNQSTNTRVDALDTSGIQSHYSGFNMVSVTNPYDVNRDRYVNALDFSAAQAHYTGFGSTLILLATSRSLMSTSNSATLSLLPMTQSRIAEVTPSAMMSSAPAVDAVHAQSVAEMESHTPNLRDAKLSKAVALPTKAVPFTVCRETRANTNLRTGLQSALQGVSVERISVVEYVRRDASLTKPWK
jgi:hypothetical protein